MNIWALFILLVPSMCHLLPKCMSYHKAIGGLIITRRLHFLSFWLHVQYAHPISVGSEHNVYHESLLNSFIMLLSWLDEYSLVHWYKQCVTVHHVPKYMSYHEVTGGLAITGRAQFSHISLNFSYYCSAWNKDLRFFSGIS